MAGGGGDKRRFQYCTDASGTIVYFRALQRHPGCNLIDPSLQDNVVTPSNFFQKFSHIGCAFNLHSIISSRLIPGGQNSSKRQTVFFLLVDPIDKSHKDPDDIDLNEPRRAQYLQKGWKRHQDAVHWVEINLALRKGLKFYQTRSNAIILQERFPAYCIPKVVRMETGEVILEKVYMSPRPPPKISLKHEWKRELVSEHAQRSEVGQLSRSFQSNQPILNPIRERTGRPVVETSVIRARSSEDSKDPNVEKAHERTRRLVTETNTENVPDISQTRSVHESETFNVGDQTLRERMGRPVIDHDNLSHEKIMVNEADMDFRIPWLPHSVVKHAQSTSVRELIQKIENHPDRHALQQDLRQNQAYNPFSPESKKMIPDVGNIALCELLETEPKTQCSARLSYGNIGIVYCTCGHFLQKETAVNRKFVKFTMDLLSIPECVIKKGRPHGHRYGKKPGDKEYYLANQLKKRCKKKYFQGIHDRFLRDHEFRIRMIEHHRYEEVCRRFDAHADEDHTHHLTEQEYIYYKNKWWLHSNKQGSNTIPLKQRPDFKQALSTLHQLQREAEEDPQVPSYSNKSQQWPQSSSSTWWNWQGSWWNPYPSESHDGDAPSIE